MLEKVEELRVACKNISYCGFYNKIISQKDRWKYCHHNNCLVGKITKEMDFFTAK